MSTSWSPSNLEGLFDTRVIAFTIGATFLTALLFGVAPACRSTRADVNSTLGTSRRVTKSRGKFALGKALVTLQISLSMLLLIGAGLFVQTLFNLQSAKLGFQPAQILLFGIDLPRTQYPAPKRVPTLQHMESKLKSIPGIQSVSLSHHPFVANGISTTSIQIAGKPNSSELETFRGVVGADFFRTMGIPIIYGRSFDAHDTKDSQRVAIINQLLGKKLFPNVNPVGRMLQHGTELLKVIGISGNAKYSDLRTDPPPTLYLDYAQENDAPDGVTFEIKTATNPLSIVPEVRKAIGSIDKNLPLIEVRTQKQQISATLVQEKAFSALTTAFGILALVLASIGVYGVMAYNVARRVNEIGIRLALGAQARQILSMILREGLLLAISGVVIGAIAALGLTRLIAAMLYGVTPTDPIIMVAAALLLLAVALFSAFLPARRASRIDPTAALRHE